MSGTGHHSGRLAEHLVWDSRAQVTGCKASIEKNALWQAVDNPWWPMWRNWQTRQTQNCQIIDSQPFLTLLGALHKPLILGLLQGFY
jgi:hypothetical protein